MACSTETPTSVTEMTMEDATRLASEECDQLIADAKAAQLKYALFTQEQVDKIVTYVTLRSLDDRIELAELAIAEGQLGKLEDKIIKNHMVMEFCHNHYRDRRTVGIIEDNEVTGIITTAEPVGTVTGIVPCTSPSALVGFYILMCLKTRNSLVLCAHPRTNKTSNRTAELMYKYAVEAGAPEGIIQWVKKSTVQKSGMLMAHKGTDLLLATGGAGMVKAAYSSGNPTIGVGAGNVPAIIHHTAKIRRAMADIFISKTFDNGTACTSEQIIFATRGKTYDTMINEFRNRGGYIVEGEDAEKVRNIILENGNLSRHIVGRDAHHLAKLAGITIPKDTLLIGCEIDGPITLDNPWCWEKLSPLIALYATDSEDESIAKAQDMIRIGGMGHSSVIHVDENTAEGRAALDKFMETLKTSLQTVNAPNTSVQISSSFNFSYVPSMMRGCGSWGGNTHSGPISLEHLLNIKTTVRRRDDMLWFKVPPKIYFREGSVGSALSDLKGKRKKAFIVTDKPLVDMGYCKIITSALDKIGIAYDIFDDVEPDPSATTIMKGIERMKSCQPDVVIGFGGGSPLDAAKVMRLIYEKPEVDIYATTVRFLHPRRRVYQYPSLDDAKTIMVCIPTTSGTGSEITPFAVVTSPKDGRKYATGDYELTPDMAILDPQFVMSLPPKLQAYTGMDALSHAVESIVSVQSNEFNRGPAFEAIRLMVKYLPRSINPDQKPGSSPSPMVRKAREKMHYAASIAAMSVSQVLVGITHSCAHALGSYFHLPHGLCIGFFLIPVIRFNANPKATRQAASSFYAHTHKAASRYARVARYIGCKGEETPELVEALVGEMHKLKDACLIPKHIIDLGITRDAFYAHLDKMVVAAFDDQCTLTNPRVPDMEEIRQIFVEAFEE